MNDIHTPANGPAIIHAWTPRERVRKFALRLSEHLNCPYVVHLEDNECAIMEKYIGVTEESATCMREEELDELLNNNSAITCIHPKHFRSFLADSAGVSVIVDTLKDFVPDNVPSCVVMPSCNVQVDSCQLAASNLRQQLGISQESNVVFYPGAVNKLNKKEIISLYQAIQNLRNEGHDIYFIRTGVDYCALPARLANASHVFSFGFVQWKEIATMLCAADYLVQPGGPNDYNDYRLPCKLPEFFSTGKPVILPATNIGRQVKHGTDALLLQRGDTEDITNALRQLLTDTTLRATLGKGARAFFNRTFSWENSAKHLSSFYYSITT
jgi:glycosyltransferase involved in cell wall biosynthesis